MNKTLPWRISTSIICYLTVNIFQQEFFTFSLSLSLSVSLCSLWSLFCIVCNTIVCDDFYLVWNWIELNGIVCFLSNIIFISLFLSFNMLHVNKYFLFISLLHCDHYLNIMIIIIFFLIAVATVSFAVSNNSIHTIRS